MTHDPERAPGLPVVVACSNLIAEGGRYLLVRETKESARRRYNLPAGRPELGETLIETAVREALEETGLTVAIDDLVGIYHCPKTSEGFGVVNFVFAARTVSGAVAVSPAHPEVRYFSREEIAALAAVGMLRGMHVERAIEDYEAGRVLPLSVIDVVGASPLPGTAHATSRPTR